MSVASISSGKVDFDNYTEQKSSASDVAGNLHSAEEAYMKAVTTNSKDAPAKEVEYRRALRVYETFMQLMKNMHETIMAGIRRIDVRG